MTDAITTNRPAIRIFVAYRLISRCYFHLSVLFVFLLDSGHSVRAIASVLAAYGLGLALLTPLTPRLVATLGPGRALVAGELLKAAGLVALATTSTLVSAALGSQLVNALGFALAVSADSALAGRLGDPATVRRLQASTQSLMFIALLVSGVAGGALYLVDSHWPLYAAALAATAAAVLAGLLSRQIPDTAPTATAGRPNTAPGGRRMAPTEIRWVTYYVLTRGFMLGVFIGLLPYLIFRTLGVNVLQLTVLLAAYSLAAFLTARYADQLLSRFGTTRFALVTAVVLLSSLVVFAVSTTLLLVSVAMVLLGAASGCVRPATLAQLTTASREFRGTAVPGWLMPRMEGLFGICNGTVIVVGGVVIYYHSFQTAMFVLCAVYILCQAGAELFARRRSVTALALRAVPSSKT